MLPKLRSFFERKHHSTGCMAIKRKSLQKRFKFTELVHIGRLQRSRELFAKEVKCTLVQLRHLACKSACQKKRSAHFLLARTGECLVGFELLKNGLLIASPLKFQHAHAGRQNYGCVRVGYLIYIRRPQDRHSGQQHGATQQQHSKSIT